MSLLINDETRGYTVPQMLYFPVFRSATLTYDLWMKFSVVNLTPFASESTGKQRLAKLASLSASFCEHLESATKNT